jgi:hypothetical protein
MPKQVDLLQGTLEVLILKSISLGPWHGYGIPLRLVWNCADDRKAFPKR